MRSLPIWMAMVFAGPVAAQQPPSSRERLESTARQIERQTRDDLLAVFEPVRRYPRGNRRGVHDVAFSTRPYRTDVPGLCRRDQMYLFYAQVQPGRFDDDVPMRPYRVEAEAQYQFVRRPVEASATSSDEEQEDSIYQLPWEGECRAAFADPDGNGWEPGWFSIDRDDVTLADEAMHLLPVALAAARNRLVHVDTCEVFDPASESENDCIASLTMAAASPLLNRIARCTPQVAGNQCTMIDIDLTEIRIEFRRPPWIGPRRTAPSPADIVAISMEAYIIVT